MVGLPSTGVVGVPAGQPLASPSSSLSSGVPLSPPCPVSSSTLAVYSPTSVVLNLPSLPANSSSVLPGPHPSDSFYHLQCFGPVAPFGPEIFIGSPLSGDSPCSPMVGSFVAESPWLGLARLVFAFLQPLFRLDCFVCFV
ncbi:hypothetical protein Nepgr_029971 [Nepenthes gracilis]|uniref:Uncharacterized protein n=1 Tax=Nepenthes gracilis TaxID=150966 RepID=A0AAD3TDL0_NEPGR|nr:hypothetical protein Nepgr_029971 [Nepenthes gracilis]